MEWFLADDDAAGVRRIRHQIGRHLARHAVEADVDDAVLVVSELLANALEHGAGPVSVRLTWPRVRPVLEVFDAGPCFTLPPAPTATGGPAGTPDLLAEDGRGLYLVRRLATELAVHPRRSGGSHVVAVLPVSRRPVRSADPPVRDLTLVLPDPRPADGAGTGTGPRAGARAGARATTGAHDEVGGGHESFLRALVIQLSAGIERAGGLDLGEQIVADLGMAVGAQIEATYRQAAPHSPRLSPTELSDCFLRIEAALGGRFSIVEVTADRIVLAAARCPFGEAVRRAPSLCRVTSATFGGIAARNHPDGASVALEERIAVGDERCRVVIQLGVTPEDDSPLTHRYAPRPC